MTIHCHGRAATRGAQSRGTATLSVACGGEASGAPIAGACTILGPSNAGGGRFATIGLFAWQPAPRGSIDAKKAIARATVERNRNGEMVVAIHGPRKRIELGKNPRSPTKPARCVLSIYRSHDPSWA